MYLTTGYYCTFLELISKIFPHLVEPVQVHVYNSHLISLPLSTGTLKVIQDHLKYSLGVILCKFLWVSNKNQTFENWLVLNECVTSCYHHLQLLFLVKTKIVLTF